MSKSQDQSSYYVWYDTEFSSLDLETAHVMQVAAIITDGNLQRVLPADQDLNLIVRLPETATCSPWVSQNLAALVRRCRSEAALPLEEVNRRFADYIDAAMGPPNPDITRRPVLAGNTLQCDVQLANRHMPDVMARVHYRVIDVSSLKMIWQHSLGQAPFDKTAGDAIRTHFPGEYNSGEGVHDAHFDVLASIAELNYYLVALRTALTTSAP